MSAINREFTGIINKPVQAVLFEVANNYEWMNLELSFSKKGWYSIFLWDPYHKLRAQVLCIEEKKKVTVSINPNQTSFSATPGSIAAGEWKLEVSAHTYQQAPAYTIMIEYGKGNVEKVYTETDIWCSDYTEPGLTLDLYNSTHVYNQKKGWYKGDFHTHTNLSDGKLTPEQGMKQAKEMTLDYFVATDHNILPTKWVRDEVLVMPGIEITSTKGHFNALGLTKWIDWRPSSHDGGMETEEGMNRIIREVKEAGALVSINHPLLKPWEWQFQTTLLQDIDTIEIWNDPTYQDNPKATEGALILWDNLLNDGYQIYGIGGSDSHLLPTESYIQGGPPSVIGDPATVVKAENLSSEAVLMAVKKGRAYVSRGPVLDISITADEEELQLGSQVPEKYASTISYAITYDNIPQGSYLRWIQEGKEVGISSLEDRGTIYQRFSFEEPSYTWLRFELRNKEKELLAFGNPIFKGRKTVSLSTWGELMTMAGL